MNPSQQCEIEQFITRESGKHFPINHCLAVSGGDINQSYKVSSDDKTYFLKTNSMNKLAMFETEKTSLIEISNSNTILVPKPLFAGKTASISFLLIEYLNLTQSPMNFRRLGINLAKMHSQYANAFGWQEDNFIGHNQQINKTNTDWISFWNKNRMLYQIRLAITNQCPNETITLLERLTEVTALFFQNYQPKPSLLHGDLWAGNAGFLQDGTPVLYDPASYYGDRESDIAMTELFGGFSENFYHAYNDTFALDSGYPIRKQLYQLYHVVNHFNLFGGHYAIQATDLCRRLLSEV